MKKTYSFKIDKLVRDKILSLSSKEGVINFTREMEHEEYVKRLNDKLIEEAYEVIHAKDKYELIEELADILEVLNSIARVNDIEFEAIEEARLKKKQERGGFENKVYLHSIEIPHGNPRLSYYLARPKEYPEIK